MATDRTSTAAGVPRQSPSTVDFVPSADEPVRRVVEARYEGFTLVRYEPQSISRLEHVESATCGPWMPSNLMRFVRACPPLLPYLECGYELDAVDGYDGGGK